MHLAHDTQAVLLLTARFGAEDRKDAKPLGPKEWGDFAEWLKQRGHRPAELINGCSASLLADWTHPRIGRERLDKLLQRGNAMALALEKWERAGIWVLTRADKDYPARLKKRLGRSAPPVFFGCGNRALLDNGGLAVVGSRNADDADLEFCRWISAKAAAEGHSLVSGGARGVDETAMQAALEHEGTVIGVLTDSLLRAVTRQSYRRALRSGDLVLVSPYQPEARFQVGNAMGRNKYIYCMADASVIVTCEKEGGGTFTGARETLKNGWVPVWTRPSERASEGVASLEAMGAARLPAVDYSIASLFEQNPKQEAMQATMPDGAGGSDRDKLDNAHVETEEAPAYLVPNQEERREPTEVLFNAFLEELEPMLQAGPMKPDEIAERFQIKRVQAKFWLQKAEKSGLIEKTSKKPVTYGWTAQGRLILGDG